MNWVKLFLFVFMLNLIFGTSVFSYENRISDIKLVEGPKTTDLIIKTDAEPEYVVVKGKSFIQFDFKNTTFYKTGESIPVYKNNIRFYKLDTLSNPSGILRARIFLNEYSKYNITTKSNKIFISVYNEDPSKTVTAPELYSKIKEQEAIQKRELQARKYYILGNSALKNRNWDKAYKYYQEANTLDPENNDILEALHLSRSNVLLQKQYEADFQIAMDYYRTGDFRNAVIEFEKFLDKYPGTDKALYYMGQAAMKIDDYKKARISFRKLLKVSPTFEHIEKVYVWMREINNKIETGIASPKNVSFKAKDEYLRDVLTALVYGTGIRIIVPDSVNYKVDINLKDIPLYSAIDKIINENGLKYKKEKNIIEILERGEGGKIVDGLQFRGLPIKDVLEILAEMMKINIIINDEVDKTKTVTFYVKNSKISVSELFDLVLKTNNLTATKFNETTYFIVDSDKANLYNYQKKFQKTFYFINIKPLEFINILHSIKGIRDRLNFRNIKVIDIDNSNFGVVNAEKRNISEINSDQSDKTETVGRYTKDVIEDKFKARIKSEPTEDDKSDNKDSKKQKFKKVDENFAGVFSQNTNDMEGLGAKVKALMVYETRENIELIGEILKKVDIKRKQVLVAMKVIAVNNTAKEELGFENLFDGSANQIDVRKFQRLDKIEFSSTLKFLEQKNLVKTLSNPTVRVIDGHEAIVDVVTSQKVLTKEFKPIYAATTTLTSSGDQVQTESSGERYPTGYELFDAVEELKSGILLKVKPVVHRDKEITLSIGIDESSLGGKNSDGMYIKTSRNANTVVRVKDGQTIVMGGLINTNNTNTENSTPFLGKLPGIGKLFRKTSKNVEKKELIILLTTYIVNENKMQDIAFGKNENKDLKVEENISRIKNALKNN